MYSRNSYNFKIEGWITNSYRKRFKHKYQTHRGSCRNEFSILYTCIGLPYMSMPFILNCNAWNGEWVLIVNNDWKM